MLLILCVLQRRDYFTLGKIVSVSILQGGPGLPFISREVFQYIGGCDITAICPDTENIPDSDVFLLAQEVIYARGYRYYTTTTSN